VEQQKKFIVRPAEKCPSCEHRGTLVPFIAADGRPAYWRLSALTEDDARSCKTLFGGTSFALQAKVCNYCSYVVMYYDEDVTWRGSEDSANASDLPASDQTSIKNDD
jgi:hypothetical protein